MGLLLLFLCGIIFLQDCRSEEEFCYIGTDCPRNTDRFLLYDVNPPEGFNLRRDVYMRFAILAHKLKHTKNLGNFKLVLPPWSYLVHWKQKPPVKHYSWSTFFDVESLQSFAPVVEMDYFFSAANSSNAVVIDEVYILQHYEDMFETGNFEDRMDVQTCQKKYQLTYFHYKNITSDNIKCLSYHGSATKLQDLLQRSTAKTILFYHAEVALHEMFGDKLYWECRRSMRFNFELRQLATEFRKRFLNSTDEADNTQLPDKWELEKARRDAKGGPYLAVHVRRQDFVRGRSHQFPSLKQTAEQINQLLERLQLNTVFIATDASIEEYQELVRNIVSKYKTIRYIPTQNVKATFGDGGVAIIDQIICSYARFFMGTQDSTFSFRIQEEREILGFPVDNTFNSFCAQENKKCERPSVWKIVY